MSADGKRLATVSDSSVAVWDVATGNLLSRFPTLSAQDRTGVFGYYTGPKILAFTPDGRRLGIAFNDDFSGVWDLDHSGNFRRFRAEGIGDSQGLCQFARDGKLFILLYDDCIRFWNPVSGNLDHQIPAAFAVGDISSDARMYGQVDHDRNISFTVRDFKTGKAVKEFAVRCGEGDAVFAPDSKTLVLTDERKKEIQIWDAPPTRVRCTFPLPDLVGSTPDDRYYPYCLCFAANSKVLMLGTSRGEIHRWDLVAKKELPLLSSYSGEIVGLHDLPDGKSLLAVRRDGLIQRFDTTMSRDISDTGRYEGAPTIAVSLNGELAAVGDSRGRLDLWQLRPFKLRSRLRSDGPPVMSVAFGADGKTLAVGLESEAVCFYDSASGRNTRTISFKKAGKKDTITPFSTLLLSPDGQLLCFLNSANELVMWDVAKGKSRWRWKDATAWGEAGVALSPDGKTLAFAPKGAEVLLLDALTSKRRLAVKLAVTAKT
jgi:WD40 repeat protein